jgi:hypothetical protein
LRIEADEMMVPKRKDDQPDTSILQFYVDIMQNEPTENSENFSWGDLESLVLRLDSNNGSGEPAHLADNPDRTFLIGNDTDSIASRIEDPYIELPDQTYRQIKELNDALKIQARRITEREEKLSLLIEDFERQKREFDRRRLGSNDQVERRLDLIIAQSIKRSNSEIEASRDSLCEGVATVAENLTQERSDQSDDAGQDAANSVAAKSNSAGLTSTPRPAFSRMKIAAREALQAAEFSRFLQRKEMRVENTDATGANSTSFVPSEPEDLLLNDESAPLESVINEAIDSEVTELTAKREATMKLAASAAAMQLGRFDSAQRKSIADTLSDLTPPDCDTVDPDGNNPDPEITKRFDSSAKQLREKSEVLSAVFVELDQMVRDLDRQQELLEKIQVDRDSNSASEFELVNKKLKRRFNRISKKISVNAGS